MLPMSRRALAPAVLLGGALLAAGCAQPFSDEDRALLTSLQASVNAAREEARTARVTAERAEASADKAARAAQAAADRAEQASQRAEQANERANRMFQYDQRR